MDEASKKAAAQSKESLEHARNLQAEHRNSNTPKQRTTALDFTTLQDKTTSWRNADGSRKSREEIVQNHRDEEARKQEEMQLRFAPEDRVAAVPEQGTVSPMPWCKDSNVPDVPKCAHSAYLEQPREEIVRYIESTCLDSTIRWKTSGNPKYWTGFGDFENRATEDCISQGLKSDPRLNGSLGTPEQRAEYVGREQMMRKQTDRQNRRQFGCNNKEPFDTCKKRDGKVQERIFQSNTGKVYELNAQKRTAQSLKIRDDVMKEEKTQLAADIECEKSRLNPESSYSSPQEFQSAKKIENARWFQCEIQQQKRQNEQN